MPVWLEYRWEDTIFHRMNPLTKIALLGGLMTYTPLVWDIRILLVLGVIAIAMNVVAKVPRWWHFLLIFIIIARGWAGFIYGLGVRPEVFRHLPYEFASIAAFEIIIPGTTLTYGITVGGLLWGLAISLQSPVTVLFAYVFIYSTGLSDLIQSLSKLKFIPQNLLYIIMVGYRFVPYMFRMTSDV
ncbi:MAG: energy-coupling factor transporter transmembrane component T family protein, partial [Candidatus Ranarchaeia archaeon]